MARATIIIPCYNEGRRLDNSRFIAFACPVHEISFLFVDDGSTDNTLALLKSLKNLEPTKFPILTLSKNSGKAEAVRQGVLTALKGCPDYVGFWDADLATPLEALPTFLDLAESRPDVEMVMGARVKLLGRRIERQASRHYLGRVFATAVSLVLGLGVYDTQCGAKVFRVSPSLEGLFAEPFASRWIFDVEIIARLIQARHRNKLSDAASVIYELPLTDWRDVSGSKLKAADFVRAAWELAKIHHRYLQRRNEKSDNPVRYVCGNLEDTDQSGAEVDKIG
jgi:glycosyltransferase involved in cell wall biosynthesis